ncbi:hypothetical protein LY78DRAFT_441481 [Colletotrichum sublineola]|nr:hypothetical protein LY78DRAFT_441481 [Colletotrichum sublineola]
MPPAHSQFTSHSPCRSNLFLSLSLSHPRRPFPSLAVTPVVPCSCPYHGCIQQIDMPWDQGDGSDERSKLSQHTLTHNRTHTHTHTYLPSPPCRPNTRRGRQKAPPSRTRHTEPSRCDARGHWPVPNRSLFSICFPVTRGYGGATLVAGGVSQKKRAHKPA